jgi:hypothetical protein
MLLSPASTVPNESGTVNVSVISGIEGCGSTAEDFSTRREARKSFGASLPTLRLTISQGTGGNISAMKIFVETETWFVCQIRLIGNLRSELS